MLYESGNSIYCLDKNKAVEVCKDVEILYKLSPCTWIIRDGDAILYQHHAKRSAVSELAIKENKFHNFDYSYIYANRLNDLMYVYVYERAFGLYEIIISSIYEDARCYFVNLGYKAYVARSEKLYDTHNDYKYSVTFVSNYSDANKNVYEWVCNSDPDKIKTYSKSNIENCQQLCDGVLYSNKDKYYIYKTHNWADLLGKDVRYDGQYCYSYNRDNYYINGHLANDVEANYNVKSARNV